MRTITLDDRETEVLRNSAYDLRDELLEALGHQGPGCDLRFQAEVILKVAGLTAFDLAASAFIAGDDV